MLKFGAVTIDVSHPNTFATKLLEEDRARYTAVFNDCFRSDEEVEAFANKFDAKIYDNLDEMIDNIDLGLVHCCNWDKHLDYIMHFVRKGKPVFVDKPIVGNMKDIRTLLELEKQGARILGTSALRYVYEVQEVNAKMKEAGAEPVFVSTTVGIDEFNYAIHAVEEICGIIQCSPVSCRFIGESKVASGYSAENYYVKFENGASAVYSAMNTKYVAFNTTVLTNSEDLGDFCFRINGASLYKGMLTEICNELEGLDSLIVPMKKMVEPIMVLLAGKASKLTGGIEVSHDSPLLEVTSFDGDFFEEGYAAKAKKAYEAAKKVKAEEKK